MNQDDWDAMWADDPEPQSNGCILLIAVFVTVWAVIIVGASWLVRT